MWRFWPAFILLLLFGSAAAQEKENERPGYLFRLEWLTTRENSCVLVKQDGSYELEASSGDRRRVFQGQFPAAELALTRQRLDSPAVSSLRQQEIDWPLLRTGELEEVVLSVVRGTGWQNLKFPTRESWGPAKPDMEALLRQLKQLHRLASEEVPEARANNCNPPPAEGTLKLRTRVAEPLT